MEERTIPLEKLDASEKKPLLEIQGSLIYLTNTRADVVAPLKVNAKNQDIGGLKRVVKYLRKPRALQYSTPIHAGNTLVTYADSDWASNSHRYSISGVTIFHNGNLILHKSVTQSSIATSASEAEIYGLSEASKQLTLYVKQLVEEFTTALELQPTKKPFNFKILGDNLGSIRFAQSHQLPPRLKHVQIKDAYVRDLSEKGILDVQKCKSEENRANGLTKIIPGGKIFRTTLEQLQIVDLGEDGKNDEPEVAQFVNLAHSISLPKAQELLKAETQKNTKFQSGELCEDTGTANVGQAITSKRKKKRNKTEIHAFSEL